MSVSVRASGVGKSFPNGTGKLHVLEDVTFELDAGATLSIVGRSGSGKSTLLGLIGGLDTPTSGSIVVDDQRVDTLGEAELSRYRAHSVGLVFQFHYLLRDFTTIENVMLPALMAGESRAQARERALELLDRVGIADCAERRTPQLSGGERQRAALARALVNRPALLLADEPTGNLDEQNSRLVEHVLFDLARSEGTTLILVTHSRELASGAQRSLILEQGCLSTPSR